MQRILRAIVRFVVAGKTIAQKKELFAGVFLVVLMGHVSALAHFGLLPEATPHIVEAPKAVEKSMPSIPEVPVSLEIPSLGRFVDITNPVSTIIGELDKALLLGAVRYPTSAKLGEEGNVVLFGHSSYLPIVGNQAYRTFNGIQKLVAGDEVRVFSSGFVYVYRVVTVEEKSAEDDGILLSVTGKILTLSTCDSFGQKSDRFVVTADFVESHPISS